MFFLRCPISEVTERRVHGSPKRCPFSCRITVLQEMSGLRSWTEREFHRRAPAAADVFVAVNAECQLRSCELSTTVRKIAFGKTQQ